MYIPITNPDKEYEDAKNSKPYAGATINEPSAIPTKENFMPTTTTTDFDPSFMRPEGISDDDWNHILSSNPYANSVLSRTNWDEFVSALGFRSKYDVAEAERLQNSKNYISQAIERWRQDKYNSPAEQVKRELDAGINPNISGDVDNVPSAGSPDSQSPISDMSDAYQVDTDFGEMINIGLSSLVTVCQVSNAVMDMGKRKMELRNLDALTTKGIFDFTESFANRTVPDTSTIPEFEQYIKQGYTPQEAFSFIMDNTIDAAAKEAKDGTPWFRNKRNARLFTKSLSEYKQSSNYKAVKNRAFSAYLDSYENRVFDEAELNSIMKQYDDFISLMNEYYYPTMAAEYKLYLDDANTMLQQNQLLRKQYGLDSQIIDKEKGILDQKFQTESSRLAYDKASYDQAVQNLAIELARIEAQGKIAAKVTEKLDKKGEDVSTTTLMFWNSVLNKLNSDMIGEATRLGLDVAKMGLSFGKSFITPKPRTIISNVSSTIRSSSSNTNVNYNYRK